MNHLSIFLSGIFYILVVLPLTAQQQVIFLHNSSFENVPGPANCPIGWEDCGLPGETPPDIHPARIFGVQARPIEGQSFLGMVVRDNNTGESISQQLNEALQIDQCYSFHIHLAQSPDYHSISPTSGQAANFNVPVKLQIWGSATSCAAQELLAESPRINHTDWQYYQFDLKPSQAHTHIQLRLVYDHQLGPAYNGNLLLDGASPLLPVDCQSHAPLFEMHDLPSLSSKGPEAIWTFFSEHARNIQFLERSSLFQQHIYQTPRDNTPAFNNKYLAAISEALLALPDYKMTFVVFNKPRMLADQRVKALKAYLYAYGLSPEQYEVRLYKRSDRKKQWWSHNTQLLTQLEQRKQQP